MKTRTTVALLIFFFILASIFAFVLGVNIGVDHATRKCKFEVGLNRTCSYGMDQPANFTTITGRWVNETLPVYYCWDYDWPQSIIVLGMK